MNANDIIALLGLATQLLTNIKKIAKQTEQEAPEVWAQVSDHYNAAVAAFQEEA